jgi:hypothetical protein
MSDTEKRSDGSTIARVRRLNYSAVLMSNILQPEISSFKFNPGVVAELAVA